MRPVTSCGTSRPGAGAGVHADDGPAAWVEHNAGRLQEGRVGVGERAGRIGDHGGVGAVTDWEPQAIGRQR